MRTPSSSSDSKSSGVLVLGEKADPLQGNGEIWAVPEFFQDAGAAFSLLWERVEHP